jgi:hypothetical protein
MKKSIRVPDPNLPRVILAPWPRYCPFGHVSFRFSTGLLLSLQAVALSAWLPLRYFKPFCVWEAQFYPTRRGKMPRAVRPLVCQQCAREKTDWTEDCPHVTEVWKDGYNRALRERPRPRLTSEDLRKAISGLSNSWANFYHLGADTLNCILDEKDRNS